MFEKGEVGALARRFGWQLAKKGDRNVWIYERMTPAGRQQVNVYHTTGTVSTSLKHPVKGRTQLHRRGVMSLDELGELFRNPREHTGKGYYRR
jgi:hypothetical protein